MHDSCDCDMCVDEKHVVKMMKHLLMIQKLMLIKSHAYEAHVDKTHAYKNYVDKGYV